MNPIMIMMMFYLSHFTNAYLRPNLPKMVSLIGKPISKRIILQDNAIDFEIHEIVDSWDEGEVAWDFPEYKDSYFISDPSVLQKSEYSLFSEDDDDYVMADGEVPWTKKEFNIDIIEMQSILNEWQKQESVSLVVENIYKQAITSDKIMDGVTDWSDNDKNNNSLTFENDITMFIILSYCFDKLYNYQKKENKVNKHNKKSELAIFMFAFIMIFTKGVHSVF